MKTSCLCLIFSLCVISVHSQSRSLQWSPETFSYQFRAPNSFKQTQSEVIGEWKGNLYLMLSSEKSGLRKGMELLRLDADLNIAQRQEISMTEGKTDLYLEKAVLLEGRLYVFAWDRANVYASRRARKGKSAVRSRLYVQEIDISTLMPVGDQRVLDSYSNGGYGAFSIAASPAHTHIAILGPTGQQKKSGDSYRKKVALLDASLQVIWERVEKDDAVFADIVFGDNGIVYFSEKTGGDAQKLAMRPQFMFVVYGNMGFNLSFESEWNRTKIVRYDPSTQEELEKTLCEASISDKVTYERWWVAPDGNVAGLSTYGNNDKSEHGIYLVKLNFTEKRPARLVKQPFDGEWFDLLKVPQNKRNLLNTVLGYEGKSDLDYFSLQQCLATEDGGMVIFTELTGTRPPSAGLDGREMRYQYHDVWAIKWDPTLSIDWVSHIPKKQETSNGFGRFGSFQAFEYGNTIHLWYNDHPDNLTSRPGEELAFYKGKASGKEAILRDISIQPDGKASGTTLWTYNQQGFQVNPRLSTSYLKEDAPVILFYAEEGKRGSKSGKTKIRLGRMELAE